MSELNLNPEELPTNMLVQIKLQATLPRDNAIKLAQSVAGSIQQACPDHKYLILLSFGGDDIKVSVNGSELKPSITDSVTHMFELNYWDASDADAVTYHLPSMTMAQCAMVVEQTQPRIIKEFAHIKVNAVPEAK